MANQASTQVWNVPNRITAARLGLSVVVFALIAFEFYWSSLVVFVLAAATDWIDGWYARKFNLVTKLGRVLDPFCDKILICGTFIFLAVAMRDFPWYLRIADWMAVVVVGRELLVTLLRSMVEQSGGDFSAKMAGKLKMWFQCVAAGSSLVALALASGSPESRLPVWLVVILVASIWLAVLSTVQSGIEYVNAAAKYFVSDKQTP
jgi:CDP-diacylglycerol--glycerol-3-phosphate 3-phosphatidyltransferase